MEEQLALALDGWEGPLDLLLALARTQKVDLRQLSLVALVDAYLAFVARAGTALELAARENSMIVVVTKNVLR